MKRYFCLWQLIIFMGISVSGVSIASQTGSNSISDGARIGVLYPQSSKRASQLYKTIIQSMQKHRKIKLFSRQLSADDKNENIQQWVRDKKIQALILLGKKGLQFSLKLTLTIPVLSGAHMETLPGQSAVTLRADPLQLFDKLKKLKPKISTIHVVYNEKNSGWLIRKAKSAARKMGLKINATETNTLQASAQALKTLVKNIDADREAIWLPYDPILPVKPLLPDLLKQSWQKNLIIFSGNPYHVQQGVLFALFPDYSKLGEQLVDLALNKIHKNGSVMVEVSQYLNSAINIRTATHLGILLSSVDKDNYKMVFPKN